MSLEHLKPFLLIRAVFFCLLLLLVSSPRVLFAQIYLVVDKPHQGKKYRIYQNDVILLKLKEERKYRSLRVEAFIDSALYVKQGLIYLEDIDRIKIERLFFKKVNNIALIASLGYSGMEIINRGVVGTFPFIAPQVFIASSIIFGVYIVTVPFKQKVYKQSKYRYRVLNTNPI